MSADSFSEESIAQIVIEEFPYPVALAYQRLLETDDPTERALLCLETFHFSIRAIAFAVIIRYLLDSHQLVNHKALNDHIQQFFNKYRSQRWIELLQFALQAYRDHHDSFFMPELYDLYWDRSGAEPAERKGGLWDLLNDLARLDNEIKGGEEHGSGKNPAAIADELVDKLRQVIQYFVFMRHYHLWYVRENDGRRLTVEEWRGQEKSVRRMRSEDIREMKEAGLLPDTCERRPVKYLNNIVEQDHRFIKRRVNPGLGFGSYPTAWRTIQGYEVMPMISKGQIKGVEKGDSQAQNQFIAELFGLTM